MFCVWRKNRRVSRSKAATGAQFPSTTLDREEYFSVPNPIPKPSPSPKPYIVKRATDTPHTSTRPCPPLPVELYRPIVKYVDQRSVLCTLCIASKTWYTEAIPYLYRSVSVSAAYLQWCNTIVEKPFLAEIVRSFSITFFPDRKRDINYFVIRLALALRNLVNLETLTISNGEGSKITTHQILSAFDACGSINLRQFDCRIPWPYSRDVRSLLAFLERHPGITEFRCNPDRPDLIAPREVIVPAPLLANLTHLSCSVDLFVGLADIPALESLQVSCWTSVELQLVLRTLVRVQKTLRKLCLRRCTPSSGSSERVLAGSVVRGIAEGVPMLHSLCVHDNSMRTYATLPEVDDFISSFARFPQLHIVSCSKYVDKPEAVIYPTNPFAISLIQVAERFMMGLPSLRIVMIPNRGAYRFTRSGASVHPVRAACEEPCLGC
ncbi:hypothetical protein JAAARDRAFT_33549 [Jaapia argillacea MUCL 33604]|uniref:F-box domain-containing protein n=1 Tax=Jaapia argillacea MUCL 33604 TaxID=933084 RepID=A0A067PZ52_9AGAM|nr:hypothetical protein JAAARDRAFT_33549 [Jaapia argillacea MUCL 33604]